MLCTRSFVRQIKFIQQLLSIEIQYPITTAPTSNIEYSNQCIALIKTYLVNSCKQESYSSNWNKYRKFIELAFTSHFLI